MRVFKTKMMHYYHLPLYSILPETETTTKRGEISSASRRKSGTTYFPYICGQEQDYEKDFTFTFSAWRRGLRRSGAAVSPAGCGTGKTDGHTDGCCHSGRRRSRSWRFGHCGGLQCRHLYQHLNKGFQH